MTLNLFRDVESFLTGACSFADRLKTVLSCHFVDKVSSSTFSFSTKKRTTCGMAAHRHGPAKSSSELCFGRCKNYMKLSSVSLQNYNILVISVLLSACETDVAHIQ